MHTTFDEIKELHDKKNTDYAVDKDPFSNFRECEKIGIPAYKGIMVRMSDKWSRLCNLISKDSEGNYESIEDTFKDLAVYSLIAYLMYQDNKGRKQNKTK